MSKAIYLQVSKDKYRLPIAFADTPKKLARITGVDARNISSICSKYPDKGRFVKVVIDDEK